MEQEHFWEHFSPFEKTRDYWLRTLNILFTMHPIHDVVDLDLVGLWFLIFRYLVAHWHSFGAFEYYFLLMSIKKRTNCVSLCYFCQGG